jgi:hypothetical protein
LGAEISVPEVSTARLYAEVIRLLSRILVRFRVVVIGLRLRFKFGVALMAFWLLPAFFALTLSPSILVVINLQTS